jgi:hypothetical protein
VGIHEALPRHDSQAHDAIWAMSTAIVQTAPRSAPKSDKHRHLEPLADSMREYRIRAMESSLLSFEIGVAENTVFREQLFGWASLLPQPHLSALIRISMSALTI